MSESFTDKDGDSFLVNRNARTIHRDETVMITQTGEGIEEAMWFQIEFYAHDAEKIIELIRKAAEE